MMNLGRPGSGERGKHVHDGQVCDSVLKTMNLALKQMDLY